MRTNPRVSNAASKLEFVKAMITVFIRSILILQVANSEPNMPHHSLGLVLGLHNSVPSCLMHKPSLPNCKL